MPALIVHDTFGRDIYDQLFTLIGGSRDEAQAFLLGNQGPDPLFYAVANGRITRAHRLGSIMHKEQPSALLAEFRRAVEALPKHQRAVGRAYALGFLCHYELDSTVHPFVYAQQYAICDAGVPGLERANGHDVHALIEREFDELALTVKRETTIATFNPAKEILRASNQVLEAVSTMYDRVAAEVYDWRLPHNAFGASVKAYRHIQQMLYSPNSVKRVVLDGLESLVRPYSFLNAMSHRNHELTSSEFGNDERRPWSNPYTGETSSESFWDLYDRAKTHALGDIPRFDAPSFNEAGAREITGDVNFSGKPTNARLLAVETVK